MLSPRLPSCSSYSLLSQLKWRYPLLIEIVSTHFALYDQAVDGADEAVAQHHKAGSRSGELAAEASLVRENITASGQQRQ